MRKLLMCALILSLLPLCGCAATMQPENQAFAASMSVDFAADSGLLEIGILIPVIAGASDGSGGNPDFLRHYAIADTFASCLSALQISMPFTLNLSQLKTIVISRQVAQSDLFAGLIQDMMLTNHLYNTSYLAISLGAARQVLENSKPVGSGQLSTELDAAYEHYGQIGFVPLTRLGDMYYHMVSCYGEPFCMLIATADPDAERMSLPNGTLGKARPGKLPVESDSLNQHLGSALFKDGKMVGVLDGSLTRWARVISGEIKNFGYQSEGHALRLMLRTAPGIDIDTSKSAPVIHIKLSLLPIPQRTMPDIAVLKSQIRAEIENLFQHVRSLGVDPLHLGSIAAKRFATIAAFEEYNWPDCLRHATMELEIEILSAYTFF